MRIQQNGVLERFTQAVLAQDRRFANDNAVMIDENQDETVRKWLDEEATLPWSTDGVTPDEWFFITTLYGEMTLEGQRTHIRAFFLAGRRPRRVTCGT